MSVEQLTTVLGWLFVGFLAVAAFEFLFFVGVKAIRSTAPVFSMYTRVILFLVLVIVCLGAIAGTIVFVHSRVTLTLALPASVRFFRAS